VQGHDKNGKVVFSRATIWAEMVCLVGYNTNGNVVYSGTQQEQGCG